MRIRHIVYECVAERHRGGISKIVLELARAQAGLGHQVRIDTIGRPSQELLDGVEIRRFPQTRLLPRAHSAKLSRDLRQVCDDDVLHTHNTFLPLNQTARHAARRGRATYFVSPHGALDPALLRNNTAKALKKRAYVALLERPNLNSSHGILVNGSREQRWLEELGIRSPIFLAPNGISRAPTTHPSDVSAFASRWGLTPQLRCVLYVGRLVEKKGLHDIVAAFVRIHTALPNTVLLLAGDRSEDPAYVRALDRALAQSGVKDAVRWLGFLDERSKPAAYASATVFVHASLSEGMPMAVLEAMGAGMACVVTPGTMLGGIARLEGVVEAERDSFAGAIELLLRDDDRRAAIERSAQALARGNYSWDAVARLVCEHYSTAAARRLESA